jgi:hypothetical protein
MRALLSPVALAAVGVQSTNTPKCVVRTLPSFLEDKVAMAEFLTELWSFLRERKKFWLLPIIVCLVLLSSLIIFTSGSAVAPFIYTLF